MARKKLKVYLWSAGGFKCIEADGYPMWRYLYYSWRQAEQKYRKEYGLERVWFERVKK